MSGEKPLLLILDAKIQKQRLRDMKNAALKRKIDTTDAFSLQVTHIVTEFDNTEAVLRKLDINNLDDLQDVYVVKVKWFTDCMKAGHVIDVTDDHKVKAPENADVSSTTNNSNSTPAPWMTDYACQRATPLNHLNGKFTDALEILQEHAELRDGEHDYSRALAFRRASCVLKSIPFSLSNMNQLRNVVNIGNHSRRIIQEILEEGESTEVQDIATSPWFQKMKLFSGIFGVGPSTAKKWIDKGWSTVKEAQLAHTSGDWRVRWGLGFHDDLTTPVSQSEAMYIKNLVQSHLTKLLPGAIMQVTGGFRRFYCMALFHSQFRRHMIKRPILRKFFDNKQGKTSGHDVDILITHPKEDKEIGVLPRLLQQLQSSDAILCGKWERSTFTEEVLYKDSKISMRGQLDHFEKWMGIFKLPKSASGCQDVDVLYERTGPQAEQGSDKTSEIHTEKLNSGQGEQSDKDKGSCSKDNITNTNETDSKTESDKSLNESIDEYEPNAKKQRTCTDSDLSPLELSAKPRDWTARRVDLIVSPYSQYFYSLVGWTGNKQFNRDLRLYATRELGMHLTSHGLYDLTKMISLPADSEQAVFENLKIPYRPPSDRNC